MSFGDSRTVGIPLERKIEPSEDSGKRSSWFVRVRGVDAVDTLQVKIVARDRALGNDRVESFSSFYLREFPAMVALAHALSGSAVFAEDIAQEALIRSERHWDRIGRYDKPGAWVRRVTIRLAISSQRRMRSELAARLRLGRPATIEPPPPAEERLWAEVRRLPGKQRAAVALFYIEDRSVEEIAGLLDCAESTARVHLTRGRATLADRLGGMP